MAKSREEIRTNLLKEAQYYWHDKDGEIDAEKYDPVVNKMFSANAFELEKIYSEIEQSRQKMIVGLSETLMPDQLLLPEPGYTVVQINPKYSRIDIQPEDEFLVTGQDDTGEEYKFYFTPLFKHNYPKCELCVILTEHTGIQIADNEAKAISGVAETEHTSHIWLGLKVGSNIEADDRISFFIGNHIMDDFQKNIVTVHRSKWLINGNAEQELHIKRGIKSFKETAQNDNLLDKLDIQYTYDKQILSRFKNNFIQIILPDEITQHKRQIPPIQDAENRIAGLDIEEPLLWIKMEFSIPVPDNFFLENILYPNAIPLINRRLITRRIVKKHYDRILLPMATTDIFLGIHKVWDEENKKEDKEYQLVNFSGSGNQPGTYMLRDGSQVRRFDKENASEQIYRLLEIIQDERDMFKVQGVNRLEHDFDIIAKAIKRITDKLPESFAKKETNATHFCIANLPSNVYTLWYSYWETQGDKIDFLKDKTGIEVSSKDTEIEQSYTIIPIQRGKGQAKTEDYVHLLREAIVSRGKIVTQADIELYCNSKFRHLIQVENVEYQLMSREDGGLQRGVLVSVKTKDALSDLEMKVVKNEFQNGLNANSAFFNLIKVQISNG